MTAPGTDADLMKLFIQRTHHRQLVVGEADSATGSRVGGKPPAPLAASSPRCPVCAGPLWYVLTLAADTLGDAIAKGRALSLLTCRDAACRHKSHEITTPSSLVVIVHDDAPRATRASKLDSKTEGRALSVGPLTEDAADGGQPCADYSKIGGRPGYIQGWGEEQEAKAGGFLFQWSDDGYPDDMEVGPSPFLFGVAYVFSQIDPSTKLPVLEELRGFWQNT